jgi:hypothetical protein
VIRNVQFSPQALSVFGMIRAFQIWLAAGLELQFWHGFAQWQTGLNRLKGPSPRNATATLPLPLQNCFRTPRKFFWTPEN